MKTLADRIAVVTGAASGIGRATAKALAESGCQLALVDIDSHGLDETRAQIESEHSVQSICYEADVGDAEAVKQLATAVADDFGAVHIVVNNAGINVTASFDEHTIADFEKVFAVNIWGVIHGCREFLPHLRRADEGHIVNISSAFGIVGVARQTAYSASKFAVRGFSESLHEELLHSHINVSVVHPGCIDTNIIHTAQISENLPAEEMRSYFNRRGCHPQVVARRIVGAIRRNEHRVLITPETHLFDGLRRLFPTMGNRIANLVMDRLLGI